MNIVLLNEDNLSAKHPVFDVAAQTGEYQTLFIFDDSYLEQEQYSLKRIVFIYECLQDIECSIFKGSIIDILTSKKPEKVFISYSPNPYFKNITEEIKALCDTEIVAHKDVISTKTDKRFTRFFPYWKHIKNQLLNI